MHDERKMVCAALAIYAVMVLGFIAAMVLMALAVIAEG